MLIVDEISMVSDWQLELMDRLGRAFRDKDRPFGGIQLVLCGDFLQLAPIDGALCFKSRAWHEAHLQRFELTYAFRQGADGCFAAMLAEVRTGQPSDDTLAALQSAGTKDTHDDIEPTLLYTTNAKVDDENRMRLSQLPGVVKRFVAQDSGEKHALKRASAWTNAPDTLDLKIDAQVVLLRNLDIAGGLVNGSRGVVVGFSGTDEPVVRFACGATMTIARATWTKKNDMERTVATRAPQGTAAGAGVGADCAQSARHEPRSGARRSQWVVCACWDGVCGAVALSHTGWTARDGVVAGEDTCGCGGAGVLCGRGGGSGQAQAAQSRRERTDAACVPEPALGAGSAPLRRKRHG